MSNAMTVDIHDQKALEGNAHLNNDEPEGILHVEESQPDWTPAEEKALVRK